ncbi:MAG: helix-turn-helix domain-containing protein [Paracoccus sp. (in: a-proteobacteria)]|uniref:winged helix-turn-helix transcriptional regulator n=1 Tax=Paracoccus sp. TaxID=267 RepID=UPI0026DF4BF9|nr:helix-turn-helix domain-containing protein [Paracoccus sp. (in: a-proteobacteria)]MDO5612234.1 helix-turn-helix domain-containing protein [Paracoccus sp. (in: a-proteobacteria)]
MSAETHDHKICPVENLFSVVAGRWTPYLIFSLATQGPQRFGALQRHMPRISTKVLTDRLRMLERSGLVHREQAATIPPQVTYSLTPRGEELHKAMKMLGDIAQRWAAEGWTPDAA